MKTIYIYLLEGIAQWEIGYIVQAISMETMIKKGERDFEIKIVACEKKPIKTLGGLTLIPDITIDEIDESHMAALLLPGSDTWNNPENEKILYKAADYFQRGIVVGAICGATFAIANLGMLDHFKHTSNALECLKMFSKEYRGEKLYIQENSVRDQNLVTASSAGGLMWARDILQALNVYPEAIIEAWYNYYLTGDPKFYIELMKQIG